MANFFDLINPFKSLNQLGEYGLEDEAPVRLINKANETRAKVEPQPVLISDDDTLNLALENSISTPERVDENQLGLPFGEQPNLEQKSAHITPSAASQLIPPAATDIMPAFAKYNDPVWVQKHTIQDGLVLTDEQVTDSTKEGLIPKSHLPERSFASNLALMLPNALIRSGLFGPVIARKGRRVLDAELLWSTELFKIKVTGIQLGYSDAFALAAILKLYMKADYFGGHQTMAVSDILREQGKNPRSGGERKRLKQILFRLSGLWLDISTTSKSSFSYWGKVLHLKDGIFDDNIVGIKFDPKIVNLLGSVTHFDKEMYLSFKESTLPLALYFKSVRDKDGTQTWLQTSTIKQMIRSEVKNEARLHCNLRVEFNRLVQKGVIANWTRNKKEDCYYVTY